MTRHFLRLYLLIVVTLTAINFGADWILQRYEAPDADPITIAAKLLAAQLASLPPERQRPQLEDIARRSGVGLELYDRTDIAGRETLVALDKGEIVYVRASGDESWALRKVDETHIVAIRALNAVSSRGTLEWCLTLGLYALIALAVMVWIWPLTRDLRFLRDTVSKFGDRNWKFSAAIQSNSPIYPLANSFRKMAARIDRLIASHKDMTNAISHEIRTPLARMRFGIEIARQETDPASVSKTLDAIHTDVVAIGDLVTATLGYAAIDRADLTLKVAPHDFTVLVPAIADCIAQQLPLGLAIETDIQQNATNVVCDLHLMEAVVRNLVGNASRYARWRVHVRFEQSDSDNVLFVDDDGPGIPEGDRQRVFESFVQLQSSADATRTGFGLGLAIVRRAAEWHGGDVSVNTSPLGGARLVVRWPKSMSE